MSTTDNPPTTTSPINPPTAAHHDLSTMLAREPCAGCGAPLGADQRYCLSCGIPRAGTRLPFLDVLHSEAASAGVIERESQPAALLRMPALAGGGAKGLGPGHSGRWGGADDIAFKLRENTGLFALLGVLLLALLIGLLLGHWVNGGSKNVASVPAKQVIEIKGLPAAPATSGAGTATGSAESTAPSPSKEASSTAPTKHAANPTVNTLAKSTGKEHAKAVEKALSKGGGSLSTGGAPPPEETSKAGSGKPIGGGSEVASIE
jgi:hypothetical protein